MICRIAELVVQVPEAGGMAPRCEAYLIDQNAIPDIVIDVAEYELDRFPNAGDELPYYMESGRLFFRDLLQYDGIMLHSSAVEYKGKAYLFSGPCCVGKSTHTRLWQQFFGADAQVFNDDKPILRLIDGRWYAYGTPWCGKDGINQNKKVPVAGICFLQQGVENTIRRMSPQEAVVFCLSQTNHYLSVANMDLQVRLMDKLVQMIPVYEMYNNATQESVLLSSETMGKGTEEAGL